MRLSRAAGAVAVTADGTTYDIAGFTFEAGEFAIGAELAFGNIYDGIFVGRERARRGRLGICISRFFFIVICMFHIILYGSNRCQINQQYILRDAGDAILKKNRDLPIRRGFESGGK